MKKKLAKPIPVGSAALRGGETTGLLLVPASSREQFSVYGVAIAGMLFNQSPRFLQAEIAKLHQVAWLVRRWGVNMPLLAQLQSDIPILVQHIGCSPLHRKCSKTRARGDRGLKQLGQLGQRGDRHDRQLCGHGRHEECLNNR